MISNISCQYFKTISCSCIVQHQECLQEDCVDSSRVFSEMYILSHQTCSFQHQECSQKADYLSLLIFQVQKVNITEVKECMCVAKGLSKHSSAKDFFTHTHTNPILIHCDIVSHWSMQGYYSRTRRLQDTVAFSLVQ